MIDQNAQLKKNLRGAEQRLISDILLCTNEPESWEHFTKMGPSKGTQKDIYDLKATPSSVPKLSITDIALIL